MNRLRRRAMIVSVAVMVSAIGRPAWATDPATATMLFNEARRLVTAGRYAEACPKFEESQRLDPGIGTQFNLADCYEHTARIASAWALFLDVASAAGGTGQLARERVARKRASALEPIVSKLTIEAPKNVTGLEVRRNGEMLGGVLWNNPIPVDPGSYTIEATAPGKKKWSTVATVGPNGASVTVAIPELENGDDAAGAGAPTTDGTAVASEPAGQARSGPGRAIALGLGGAGIIGIGIGSYFGLRSIAKHSDYESYCNAGGCQPAAGPLHQDAVAAGNLSTAMFIVGGALLAGGAVLWIVTPKRTAASSQLRIAPAVGASGAGAVVAGGW
jgi:hypothetical protein